MMNNLFSIFDPSTSLNLSLNWMMIILIISFIPLTYWIKPSFIELIYIKLMSLINSEFNNLSKKYFLNNFFFVALLIMIMIMNLNSLLPFTFTPSGHMNVNLTFSLIMWIAFMMYGWYNFVNNMLIHLVPKNSPFMLMHFMVIIESISNLIRPWTLSVRLMANMLAGHLLILLSTSLESLKYTTLMILVIQIILLVLEIGVSFIQAYVYSTLSLLYYNESNF